MAWHIFENERSSGWFLAYNSDKGEDRFRFTYKPTNGICEDTGSNPVSSTQQTKENKNENNSI
jgi:hypothetical protein